MQQLASKCTCGFKSNGYIEAPQVVIVPILTPVPNKACMICDKPIIHIANLQPTTAGVFTTDIVHNHIDNTYTSVAVCILGHHTRTSVAYHCPCGWPNVARFKKWQRIQELAANHNDLKYIEDQVFDKTDETCDGFPDDHAINNKPLTPHVKHNLLAKSSYIPAYSCEKCDENIIYIGTITQHDVNPYIDNNTIHLHDSTKYTALVTCKNYHVTSAEVRRHCSCGWPDKSLVDDYSSILREIGKEQDPHVHTGRCRCLKPPVVKLPTNPHYKPIKIEINTLYKLKPKPMHHKSEPKRLTNTLVAKDLCSICNDNVLKVTESCRTEAYYPPFVSGGVIHNHDGNKITGRGKCVNNHILNDIVLYSKCECGWPLNSKQVIDLQTTLCAKHPCTICNEPVKKVKELFSTLAYYKPFVDSNNKRHTHNQNTVSGDGVCVNGHESRNIELCYKCECGWPGDTSIQPPANLLDKIQNNVLPEHVHSYNTEPCCICAAETKSVDSVLRSTANDTNDTIFALVKCANGHQTSQRCAYTCGPPCYVDKLRKNTNAMKKKQLDLETMQPFQPVTSNGFTSQLIYDKCSVCNSELKSCSNILQTNSLHKPYIDANGILHNHDYNTISGVFTCVNDHITSQPLSAKCSCGWSRSVPFTDRLKQLSSISVVRPMSNPPQTLYDAIDDGINLD